MLDSSTDGSRSRLRLRYQFVGSLDPIARRLLGPNRLAWTQDLALECATGSGDITFQAQADPGRLHGSAHFVLDPTNGACVRRLAGELLVAVPIVGSRAERRVVVGILRRLDIEAQAVNDVLSARQP